MSRMICVKASTGMKFIIAIDRRKKVSDLKLKIESISGVSCDDQILKCCGEVLENGGSIHNYLHDESSSCLNLSFGFRVLFDLQECRHLAYVPTLLGDCAGSSIESLVIPRHAKSIGKQCFYGCESLCNV